MIASTVVSFFIAVLASASTDNSSDYDTDEMREIQARYGDCVVRKKHTFARQFVLTTQFDERTYPRLMARIFDGGCLLAAVGSSVSRIKMSFRGDGMRYALADALVKREFSGKSMPPIRTAAPLPRLPLGQMPQAPKPGMNKRQIAELAEQHDRWLLVAYLADIGECLVRAEPERSFTLLMTKPVSVEESKAFDEIKPFAGQCIRVGQKIVFNKNSLRGTTALNFYRLAHAPRQPGTPAGANR